MRWKIILAVAAVAATTVGFTMGRRDAAADKPGQIATLELDD